MSQLDISICSFLSWVTAHFQTKIKWYCAQVVTPHSINKPMRGDPCCGKPIFHRTSDFNKPHKQGISQTQALINVTTTTTQDYTGNKPPMDYNINPSYTYNHTLDT